MSTIFVLVLLTFFPVFSAGVVGSKLVYVGCFKSEKTLVENGTWNGNDDVSLAPKASYANEDPQRCVSACFAESFRYAGVMKSSTDTLECSCVSSYGRSGNGHCDNCTSDTTSLQCGSQTGISIYDTNFKVPSPPQKIMLLQRDENVLRISFSKPLAPNGLDGYRIIAKPVKSYSHGFLQPKIWEVTETSQRLIGLVPGTEYNISVVAVNSEGASAPVSDLMWTKIGVPDTPPAPKILRQNRRTMTIELQPSRNTKGPISAYRLVMLDDTQASFFNLDHLVTWNDSMTIGYGYYTAAEFSPQDFPSQFVVGNGRHYGGYYNGPIPTSSHWHPTIGVISSMDGFEEVAYSVSSHDQHAHFIVDSSSGLEREEIVEENSTVVKALWIAIGCSGSILVLCTAVYVVLRMNLCPKSRRRRSQSTNQRPENHQLTAREPSHSFPINDDHTEAYTHAAFIPDEDLKSKCLEKLQQVWYVPRNFMDIPTQDEDAVQLSNGKYGPVYLSSLRNNSTSVIVYSIPASNFESGNEKNSIDSLDPEKLFKDLDELIRLDKHENVVQLIGFMEDQSNMLFAVEYGGVPLKELLLQFRQSSDINPYTLLICAMNIAEGMFHLQSYHVTHGQLAACNVLITDLEVPKITGFGLLASNPLTETLDMTRWQAVEQFQNRCVKPCDVWSFGILFWEIATLGATPYPDIRSEDFAKRICIGARPCQTELMSDSLYQIMLYCWQLDRDERPDFSRLSCSIHELLPHSKENLFISKTLHYPPYIHQYEHHKK